MEETIMMEEERGSRDLFAASIMGSTRTAVANGKTSQKRYVFNFQIITRAILENS